MDRLKANGPMYVKYALANKWHPAWRYSSDPANRDEAEKFLNAVRDLRDWITNNI